MKLPEVDDDTFIALLVLLEGIERRRSNPCDALTYRQDKLLGALAQTLRFELAAQKMPTEPPAPLPRGVISSIPPSPDEAEIFTQWDSVLEKYDSALKAVMPGQLFDVETQNAGTRLFYDICVRQSRRTEGLDLSLHVEPLFRAAETSDGVVVVRLTPKTSLGRRYILSRQR